jgi:hypothetical protein
MTLSDVDILEPSILSCLKDDELFDTAIDGLIEITTSPESYKYVDTLHYKYIEVLQSIGILAISQSSKGLGLVGVKL